MTSKGLRHATAETAAWLSLVAYVRHALTDYDDLLTQGYDHDSARFFVSAQIDAILSSWGVRIPTKPAMHSNLKPATRSDLKPAMVPI